MNGEREDHDYFIAFCVWVVIPSILIGWWIYS